LKYVLLGDIHANLEALEAVIEHSRQWGELCFISLGDLVGYGPDPTACLNLLRELDCKIVAGNHDWAVLGKIDTQGFNPMAQISCEWTQKQLDASEKLFLSNLPLTLEFKDFSVVHGSLDRPENFYYLQSYQDASKNFSLMKKKLLFCGHTHIPINFHYDIASAKTRHDHDLNFKILFSQLNICNVGSVGQPRNHDPRTVYGLFDDKKMEIKIIRLNYNIEKTVEKIKKANLPEFHGKRLFLGI
jgi:diadenosine tetraphosphatase ApaH/serine/threonine PP2A family protein phosphatase